MASESSTAQWYKDYYSRTGGFRNSLSQNKGVLFQTLALESSVVRAAYRLSGDPATARVLDVGCGGGGNLYQLVRLDYRTSNITGLDIQSERICEGQESYPGITFICGDAGSMTFPDGSFDLVTEFTMFATLPDDDLSARIAREMVRVCRPGGHLLLVDWRTPKPGARNYKALTRRRLRELFAVGLQTRLISVSNGALIPPLGRLLSAHAPGAYFLVASLFPFLVGQVAYLLEKAPESLS